MRAFCFAQDCVKLLRYSTLLPPRIVKRIRQPVFPCPAVAAGASARAVRRRPSWVARVPPVPRRGYDFDGETPFSMRLFALCNTL